MTTPKYQIDRNIPQEIFRSYDIRGLVDSQLSENNVYAIGLAIGNKVRAKSGSKVVVGRDGRLSGPKLLAALSQGLMDSGCDVISIEEVTTPVLYYATCTLDTNSGVMVTGSHNPPGYNGIKIVIAGETIHGQSIQELYQAIVNDDLTKAERPGKLSTQKIVDDYINRVTSDIKLKRKLKIVIDCGNGVGGVVAPKLFHDLGCETIELFCKVDGTFPNHHPDPSIVENLKDLQEAVIKNNADVGLAFDGDADRIGLVTNKGTIILPDRILMYFALDLLSRYKNEPIPFDVKCTRHVATLIDEHGGKPVMIATGHSILKAKMKELKALIGGELSGHIFIKERWYGFDDGIYVAARLLELLAQDKRSVEEIFAALPNSINTPEIKIAMPDAKKAEFMEKILEEGNAIKDAKVITTDGLRVEFKDGFGLIRPSNTTPFLTVRFEGNDEAALKRIQEEFKQLLLTADASLEIPF